MCCGWCSRGLESRRRCWVPGPAAATSLPPNPVRVCEQPDLPGCYGLAPAAGEAGFGGGWFGYLGFGSANGMRPAPPAPGGPAAALVLVRLLRPRARRDRPPAGGRSRRWSTPGREEALELRLASCPRARRAPAAAARVCLRWLPALPSPTSTSQRSGRRCSYIRRRRHLPGQHLPAARGRLHGDPLDAFCAAVERWLRRTPRSCAPRGAIASLSPELFLRRRDRGYSPPIKGTGRGDSDVARQLDRRSAKDHAENVMIVDLMRNDLGRVCVPGRPCRGRRARGAIRASGTWSPTCAGTLPPGRATANSLRATFPPGR